ncbi:MAG: sulfotransferase domain-containing protein [Verrucomicrobiota bacterium]
MESHLVLCLGMSRAGSTLQYNLARTLVERLKAGSGLGFSLEEGELRRRVESIQDQHIVGVLKTYNRDLNWVSGWRGRVSILFIYRDLRDVYSSQKKKGRANLDDSNLEDFITRTNSDLDVIEKLRTTHRMLSQKYEEVFLDLGTAARQIADFLGLQANEDDVAVTRQLNTVDAALAEIGRAFSVRQRLVCHINRFLRKQHQSGRAVASALGLKSVVRMMIPSNDIVSGGFMLHPDHISISRGQPGKWKEELPECVAGRIAECFEKWLEEHGYT